MGFHYFVVDDPPGPPRLWKNAYYDTPDGKGLFNKIRCITRDAGLLGLGVGVLDGYIYRETQNWQLLAVRIMKMGAPYLMAALPFPIIVHSLVNAREKQDNWNYFIAGNVSGMLWSIGWGHNRYTMLGRMIVFGLGGALFHQVRVKEGELFYTPQYHYAKRDYGHPSFRYWLDWAPTRERQGNWTRDPPPQN